MSESLSKSGNNAETENLLSLPEIIIDDRDSLATETRPVKAPTRCRKGRICMISCCLVFYLLAAFYLVMLPLIFRLSLSLQRELLFFNDLFRNVSDPLERGLNCTTVMHLDSDGDIKLGVWYIPPVSQCNSSDSVAPSPREALADAKLVILYAHGSGSSRGNRFRCEAYKVFISHLDAHVVSFDYRGFGDSTPLDEPPSVEGVVNDTRVVYNWVLSSGVPPERILLWGHSLGTSVLVHMLSNLSSAKEQPMATVLEAPFTNMAEEMPEHPMNKVFRYMPWFDYMILDPLVDNVDFNFDSLSRLPKVQCPLLILHAEDDPIVPFWLGKRLYDTAREVQPETVRNRSAFHAFPAGKGYKHNFIRRAPELPHVVRLFLNSLSVS